MASRIARWGAGPVVMYRDTPVVEFEVVNQDDEVLTVALDEDDLQSLGMEFLARAQTARRMAAKS